MISRRSFNSAAASALALGGLPLARAEAANFPNRLIRLVVPYGPGGILSTFGQILSEGLPETLKQPVLVDYKPGASGNIGVDYVAKSPPDGYTLVTVPNAILTLNPLIYSKMPFDVIRDLEPVALGAVYSNILVVAKESPFHSIADIVAAAKAKPGSLSHASTAVGSTAHLAGELFARQSGITLLHVPYKSASAARTDLIGGRISLMFTDPSAIPLIQAGRLRALGVCSARRAASLPDVPSLAEQGLKDFNVETWVGIAAPAGTPKDIVHKLNAEFTRVLSREDSKARLLALGVEVPSDMRASVVAQRTRDEQKLWAPIVKDLKISMD
jgi:tripartite-type tricarboxylate transporter receptor subunit TctC